ncbi:MAG: M1 family metallopeptidase [Ferruginibacter sp.]
MKSLFILLFLFIGSIAYSQELTSGGKLKPEQAIMDIRHYTINLAVDIDQKSISGFTVIDFILSQATPVLLFDLMNDLKVEKIWVNGTEAPFTHNNALITITPALPVAAGKTSVKVKYAGKPHIAIKPPWEDGFTWAKDTLGHPWVAVTAEAAGGQIFFPCKNHPSDEPNEGADMIITVPKGLVVAAPGLLQKITKQKTTDTYYWQTKYTINNYSIVFNIGDYAVITKTYTTVNGNQVPMQFYVLKAHQEKAAHQLEILAQIASVREKYFGEYPWVKEKIGIVETPHLGMEHQTMNAYGNKFRYEKIGGVDNDGLMNHEFGHEWFGNKVTVKDWADYWIQEGICSYGDMLYVRDMGGEQEYIKRFKQSSFGITNQKPVVQGKDIDEATAYIGDIYSKGAFFMHTLRYVIGDDIFFPALKQLSTNIQYTYDNLVTTDDVEKLFSKAAATDLKPLFDLYLRTTQKLEVHITALRQNKYKISIDNINISLPMDIVTDDGVQKIILTKKGATITSDIFPQVDPDMYYLKKIIIE